MEVGTEVGAGEERFNSYGRYGVGAIKVGAMGGDTGNYCSGRGNVCGTACL